ncbi:substrate-binding periplasmic protein [Rubellimicrobium roseum]|uniref:Transporter substrate-binding domain-containing protein n=1 Tax=Rubellimicrobium roseum TaxID=687525 RepID=A0A5C4N9N3_9RHOB|nr:transporter substrate-binding domain-containing protein [Rubellimicrobium roseum]TNC66839.1 transporter substrate-binding domain-containing protein [Rubellimicrobium roseum]
MRRRASLLVLLAALGLPGAALARCEGVVPGQRPQNADRDFVGESLDDIVERGWIEFAVYEGLPPYSWEEGGEPKGLDIGIGRIIAEALGVEPRFRFVSSGENLEADLRFNVWQGLPMGAGENVVANVMLHVPYDSNFACRVEQVVFTGQAYQEQVAIAYRKDAYPENPPTPAYFRFDLVAVENDTIADFYLASFAGGQMNANIRRFASIEGAVEAVNRGEIGAAMGPRAQLEAAAGEGVAVATPPLPGLAMHKWTVGLAVHHAHRDLGYAVDDAVAAALADGRIAALFQEAGLSFTPPER